LGMAQPTPQNEKYAELLVSTGLITTQQLDIARHGKAGTGSHIDEVMIGLGMIDAAILMDTTSRAWGLASITLGSEKLDHELIKQWSGQRLIAENWMPVRRRNNGTVIVATARQPSPQWAKGLSVVIGAPIELRVTTSWDIRRTALSVYGAEIAHEAANDLWKQNPSMSARETFSRGQVIGVAALTLAMVGFAIFWPSQVVATLVAIAGIVFLIGTGFKFFIALKGAKFDVVERITKRQVAALTDAELPMYSVLVPVFREANIVANLIANLGGIDYPRDKLEILILLEEDDHETRDAIRKASPPPHFHILTVPRGQPQTKPRACNVGLYFARGEYLVIFDAEDTPEPDQLKKAVIAFRDGGSRTAVVQASLNYFNASENALTRLFTLEYSYWFDYMLAGLDAADLPIPLGGTSNHFRTATLLELGGWDPFNVTEDADLGIRASALGYRVGVINSTTMEEANTSIPNFIRQRSRWIKGYMQTTLVHARHPLRLIRQVGLRRFLSFVILIGGTPATFLLVIPFYLLTAVTMMLPPEVTSGLLPTWVLWISLLNFIVGTGLMVYLTMMGPYKRGTFDLILWALLNPLYWILHSIAAYKGLWQLITKPHYWEKTEHGLTAQAHD